MSNSSKLLVDVDKSGSMIYLPLDQIIKNQPRLPDSGSDFGSSSSSSAPKSGASAQAPNNDSQRSRDRGR